MAFDANLLFYDNTVLTSTNETVSTIVTVSKTPANGIGIEAAVTAMTTQNTQGSMTITVKEGATTSGTFTTLATFPGFTTAGGTKYLVVQSIKKYLELVSVCAGTTPSFTVKAGIVSGPPSSDGHVS